MPTVNNYLKVERSSKNSNNNFRLKDLNSVKNTNWKNKTEISLHKYKLKKTKKFRKVKIRH